MAAGVRVAEFHDLSPFALYVHPEPAVRLQQLWDAGNELVSLLDDKAWEMLSDMAPGAALRTIDAVADKLAVPGGVRNVNAYFMVSVQGVVSSGLAAAGPRPHLWGRGCVWRARGVGGVHGGVGGVNAFCMVSLDCCSKGME